MPISEDPSITLHHKENPMLTHPTLDKLQALKLMGMYHALMEQMQMPEITEVPFEERLGLLVDPTFKGVWHLSAYFEAWGVLHTTSGQYLGRHKPYHGDPATRGHGVPPETPPGSAPS